MYTKDIQIKYTLFLKKNQVEELCMEEMLVERVKSNYMFNEKEQDIILKNISLYSKIYLLGIIDVSQKSL